MPIYGGPGSIEEVTSWARLMVQAVRSAGVSQPISIGDSAWGIELSGNDNGFSFRALAPLVDFFGPHVYPTSNDNIQRIMAAAVSCELSAGFGPPVVLEEFGLSSDSLLKKMRLITTARCCIRLWSPGPKVGWPGTTVTTTT